MDQVAAMGNVLLRRRYVIAPIAAKPRISMAHVEGSGTAATASVVNVENRPFASTRSKVAELANKSVPKKKLLELSPGPIVSGFTQNPRCQWEKVKTPGNVA